jgi:hypothetical protein
LPRSGLITQNLIVSPLDLERGGCAAAGVKNFAWHLPGTLFDLWLALNEGIVKIEYHSPLSIYNEPAGIPGLVLSVTRHQGILYSGTSDGLFFLSSPGNFQQIPGIPGYCFSLLATEQSLLVGTTKGVYRVKKNNPAIQNIFEIPSYYLLRSEVNPG